MISKWLLYLETDKSRCFKLDLPSIVSGLFSRLAVIIVPLKHANYYYGSKYFIIISIFMKTNFNFSFTILDLVVIYGWRILRRGLVQQHCYSGFPSIRINLSPFTKDFRGGEQLMSLELIFCSAWRKLGQLLKPHVYFKSKWLIKVFLETVGDGRDSSGISELRNCFHDF